MAKALSYEEQAARLKQLRGQAVVTLPEAAGLLQSRHGTIAAGAATLIEQHKIGDSAAALSAAFARFMTKPATADPGCTGKTAIVQALVATEQWEVEVFLAGVRHVQKEPTWGGSVDTAGELRGQSLLGLMSVQHPESLTLAAEMLLDEMTPARAAAARALALVDPRVASAILRLKARQGDAEAEVMAEIFTTLLGADGTKNLAFVAAFLQDKTPAVVEAAGLALGSSKLPEAFGPLKERWDRSGDMQLRRALLLSLALLRHQPAIDYLLRLLATATPRDGELIVAALAIYKHDETVRGTVKKIVEKRDDAEINAALARWER